MREFTGILRTGKAPPRTWDRQITKPDAIKVFLDGTPHNPPA